MSQNPPPAVPTVHRLVRTMLEGHARHQAVHAGHHRLSRKVAAERRRLVAAGLVPPITTAPSPAAGDATPPPPTGAPHA